MQKVKSWLRLGGIVGAVSGRLRSGKMAITDDFENNSEKSQLFTSF